MIERTSITAYDPGDRWVGFVSLLVESRPGRAATIARTFTADFGVLDRQHYKFSQLVNLLSPLYDSTRRSGTIMVSEDYRQRPMGHQRFHDPQTAKLIGAFQFVAEDRGFTWATIAAGDARTELRKHPFGSLVLRTKASWSDAGNATWRHAESAWLVLARYVMDRPLLNLATPAELVDATRTLQRSDAGASDVHGLIGPQLTWSVA